MAAEAADHAPAALGSAALRAALGRLRFALSEPDVAAELSRYRDRLLRLMSGVETRTARPDDPLVVVVAGGSGAGKSTLVNTLAGTTATATGVLRPTTRVPTLVTHPDDAAWAATALPGLASQGDGPAPPRPAEATGSPPTRPTAAPPADTSRDAGRAPGLRRAIGPDLPSGVALLDTPDVDSVEVANHRLAEFAVDAADVWLWVATARSYADEVGMAMLRRAGQRQALLAVVCNQVPAEHVEVLLADLDRLLAAEGLAPARRCHLLQQPVTDGRLAAAPELAAWLTELAPLERRREVRARALAGLWAALPAELAPLGTALAAETAAADRLAAGLAARVTQTRAALDRELDAGLPVRTEVLARWQRLARDDDVLARAQSAATRLARQVRGRLAAEPDPDAEPVSSAVTEEVARVLTDILGELQRAVRRDLESDPAGRRLLQDHPALRRPVDPTDDVAAAVTRWRDGIAELLTELGPARLGRARRVSTAINATATTAILVLFSLSGGLTGGEAGIAAGAATVSQVVLTRLLGRQEVARLVAEVRAELHAALTALAEAQSAAVHQAIATARPDVEDVSIVATAGRSRA